MSVDDVFLDAVSFDITQKLIASGTNLLCIDFDLTLIGIHTGGKVSKN